MSTTEQHRPGFAPATTTEGADEVDRIVDAWNRERPDLDVAPLQVFSRVSRLARLLDLARKEAFARHELLAWEFDVLSALRRAGAPYELTPGKLIASTLVTSGTMTNRIDRMVDHGLVVRRADAQDRRMVRVQLTAEGRRRVDAAMESLVASEHEVLSSLDDGERQQLADLLRTLLRPIEDPSRN
ncbi:MarR family transcriptional regulator [Bowdeniella nasicola]|uniref:MarR family transcriptional regulator n=1 Tax=Bowdeniella nasicola TaxID=208480 RepID=A0A1Q5Q125_9ACTO|nr:MarR family transcriptional regulator [Bowdeniella nasicola]OKL53563.1 MarR family transcriptional regulator [Bowdeniella nasicola]